MKKILFIAILSASALIINPINAAQVGSSHVSEIARGGHGGGGHGGGHGWGGGGHHGDWGHHGNWGHNNWDGGWGGVGLGLGLGLGGADLYYGGYPSYYYDTSPGYSSSYYYSDPYYDSSNYYYDSGY